MSYLPKQTREITFTHSGLKNIFYTSHWIFKWHLSEFPWST